MKQEQMQLRIVMQETKSSSKLKVRYQEITKMLKKLREISR